MNWQRANTQGYYRIDDGACNVADFSVPLLVNCSGVCAFDSPFKNAAAQGRHDYYLMYLAHGQLNIQVDQISYALNAGELIIYPPERFYAYQYAAAERMAYLWVHFTGSAVETTLSRRSLETAKVYRLKQTEEIEADFEAIQRLFIAQPLYYLEEASSRLDMLLTHVGRSVRQSDAEPSRDRLLTSLNYLNRHYADPIVLSSLASMEYLSVSRYSALFRLLMGVSPQKYLIELRLKNAREMLASTDLSVSEIARSVGYDDPLYFSRLFRKHFGIPPRSARRPK